MTDAQRRSRATEAFFGRRKGKPLRERQALHLETLLPALKVDLSTPAPADIATLYDFKPARIRLEIGFGGGEHLIHRAQETPDTAFIGVEPFVNSMAKLIGSVEETGVKNIRLYDDDATELLDWLPAGSLDQIDLLYPDPWPKKKHAKRRFVQQHTLALIADRLAPGAPLRIATDHAVYADHVREQVAAHGGWEVVEGERPSWRPTDGFEAKGLAAGRSITDFRLTRQPR